jgi:hypothetical protein
MDGGAVMVRREIDRDDLARPFVTTDGQARAAVLRATEDRPWWLSGQATPWNPEQAAKAAEAYAEARLRDLGRDALLHLRERGRIAEVEYRAGRELCVVWEWQAGKYLGLESPGYMERMAASYGADRLPFGIIMAAVEADRLRPWMAWCRNARPVKPSPVVGVEELVKLVVLGNRGIDQAAGALRINHARALVRLREALARYAIVAGWVSEEAVEIFG